MSVADLISQGFGGYAGWDETEAAANFAATGGEGKYTGGGGGGGGGTAGIDMSQVPSVQEYVSGQISTEDKYFQELLKAMQEREDPLAMYTRLEEEAGLPMMRETSTTLMKEIGNIEDYLLQIEPNVSARSRESLVTEAQRGGMVAEERKPWLEKLSTVGTALGRLGERMGVAERGISTKAELGMKGQEMKLEPMQLVYSTMVDRNTRKLTGFTEDRQTLLDSLYDKLERQRTLDDREWELANTLASEEKSYLRELQSAAAQAGANITGGESTDELLRLIGMTASEETEWERAYKERTLAKSGAGAGATAKKQAAMADAARDASNYSRLDALQTKYAGQLTPEEIVQIYAANSPWGAPYEPYAQEILGIRETGEKPTYKVNADGSITYY